MIALTHCFSRGNAGDGLLIDLALDRLKRLGMSEERVVLVTLDTASIGSHGYRVVQAPGDPARSLSASVCRSLAGWLHADTVTREVQTILAEAEAVVAVGGGYLHADTVTSGIGSLVNHGHQLAGASASAAPTLYLPQSIGPLRGPIGSWIRRRLENVDLVLVRDDESLSDLVGLSNVERMPDMAVLELAEQLANGWELHSGEDFVVVPRKLPRAGSYERRLRDLASRLGAVTWAYQAHVSEKKSDARFISSLGFEPRAHLTDILPGSSGVVVSVRLHGALQALLSGWPAIHLSYNRKGFAAYADLGIGDYVHDARNFDVEVVAGQVLALRYDVSAMERAIISTMPEMLAQSRRLTSVLRDTLGVD